jgi:adenine phosphoribosyltransferase
MDIKNLIRDISDFPKEGIVFKDITTLLKDPAGLKETIKQLTEKAGELKPDIIIGVEARGFIFGAAVAEKLGCGFVPVRKPGKLPAETIVEEYALEYGTDKLAMHTDAIAEGQKVLIIDDLLATGGTVAATINLIKKTKGELLGAGFVIELDFLAGRDKLGGVPVFSLIHY